jgi:hypothetical protein
MSGKMLRLLGLALAVLAACATACAQDLVKEALASFPLETERLEYSSPAKLRALPEYARLRQRYLGPNLRSLEAQLARLGVQENDLDEIVFGWQPSGDTFSMEGLAFGRFDPTAMTRRAAEAGIAATPVGSTSAYCFATAGSTSCVAVLGRSLGAFGSLEALHGMVDARSGQTVGLSTNSSFSALVDRERKDAPIWGVAVGSAIQDWFKGWMLSQKNLQLDWTTAFKNVESLAYSVQPTDRVRLNVEMNCTSSSTAGNLRQVFDGLKVFQKVAWQNQFPNVPNPFDDLAVDTSGSAVQLSLSTPYSALEATAR